MFCFCFFLVWVFESEVGLLGSTYLRWVFLSLRFFFVWISYVVFFGLIWYFGALRFDDFARIEKMVILRFFNFWICVLRSEFVLA